jgi:hypothetical protein
MRLLCGVVVLASGCDYLFLTKNPLPVDAAVVSDTRTCFGTGLLTFCMNGALSPVQLAGAIDTTTDERCRPVAQNAAPELCVIAGTTIDTLDNVSIQGNRPLILAATSTILITAMLDASSRRGVKAGPGARSSCGAAGDGANGTASGGGGAGGTFAFLGGPGATGQAGASVGGSPMAVEPLVAILGGCPGFFGGRPAGSRARGGEGGGAIGLIAGESITVESSGRINASGASGAGGPVAATGGGGGGGAGGLILFDAPDVTISGPVYARGGGGGGGGGSGAAGTPGTNGGEPSNTTSNTGGGLRGLPDGGDGAPGCGSPNGTDGGFPTMNPVGGGGGGGGGGCGVIRIYGAHTINIPTNPAPTP